MARAKRDTTDGYNSAFASRLRSLMEEHGETCESLRQMLGISRQAVNSYTLGQTVPDIEKFEIIATHYGVSFDYLLGKSDAKQHENEEICERLGLSEKAIRNLENLYHYKKNYEKMGVRPVANRERPYVIDLINTLLEQENAVTIKEGEYLGANIFADIAMIFATSKLRAEFLYITSVNRIMDERSFEAASLGEIGGSKCEKVLAADVLLQVYKDRLLKKIDAVRDGLFVNPD